MKLTPKNQSARKFQEGGQMPVEEPAMAAEQAPAEAAPADGADQDPLMQLAQMAMQALHSQDCNLAMQVCQMFVKMLQQAQGAPQEQPGEPVYRKGGRFAYRIKH